MTTGKTLSKQKSRAFGKDCYLLGTLKDGKTFWLKEPTWDCGWYWGAGYIETYTGNSPATSRDIDSHTHYDSMCFKKREYYDHEKQCFRLSNEYVHILSDNDDVACCILSTSEQWQLSDYMKTMYTLKAAADLFGKGSSNYTHVPVCIQDKDLAERINKIELPKIFTAIRELLTPKTKE